MIIIAVHGIKSDRLLGHWMEARDFVLTVADEMNIAPESRLAAAITVCDLPKVGRKFTWPNESEKVARMLSNDVELTSVRLNVEFTQLDLDSFS